MNWGRPPRRQGRARETSGSRPPSSWRPGFRQSRCWRTATADCRRWCRSPPSRRCWPLTAHFRREKHSMMGINWVSEPASVSSPWCRRSSRLRSSRAGSGGRQRQEPAHPEPRVRHPGQRGCRARSQRDQVRDVGSALEQRRVPMKRTPAGCPAGVLPSTSQPRLLTEPGSPQCCDRRTCRCHP